MSNQLGSVLVTLFCAVSAGALGAAQTLRAATAPPTAQPSGGPGSGSYVPLGEASRPGIQHRASVLIGRTVRDLHGHRLGKLEDLVLDVTSGQLIVGLVSTSPNTQTVPVPVSAFVAADKDQIRIGWERKVFKNAPHSAKNNSPCGFEAQSLSQSFGHFQQRPPESSASLLSSRRLIGSKLSNSAGETLGNVEDVLVDVPHGRALFLLVKAGDSTPVAQRLFLIPPGALTLDPVNRTPLLKAELSFLLGSPIIERAYASHAGDPDVVRSVQQYYGLPLASADDPNRRPARARTDVPGGTEFIRSNYELERAFVAALIHTTNLAMGRNLHATAANGRLVLTGQPKSSKQRRQIVEAARFAAGPENVDDQLQNPAGK